MVAGMCAPGVFACACRSNDFPQPAFSFIFVSVVLRRIRNGLIPRVWTMAGIYADRTAGGDRDHRRADRSAVARGAEGSRGGEPDQVLEQSPPAVDCHAQRARRVREAAALA